MCILLLPLLLVKISKTGTLNHMKMPLFCNLFASLKILLWTLWPRHRILHLVLVFLILPTWCLQSPYLFFLLCLNHRQHRVSPLRFPPYTLQHRLVFNPSMATRYCHFYPRTRCCPRGGSCGSISWILLSLVSSLMLITCTPSP